MILAAEDLTKSYGEKVLFQNASLSLAEEDKVGIVGVNGTGKSTFLKTIAGRLQPDSGEIVTMRGLRLEFLSQEEDFTPHNTILMEAFRGENPLMKALRGYEIALAESEQSPDNQEVQKRLSFYSGQIDELSGWQTESDAKMILTKLGFKDFSLQAGNLSGGEQKRLALAAALIQPSDLLILDEPTNHLDSGTIIWLEEFLAQRKGALLMVTHDRYFLDHVATKIFELDQGRTFTYTGNYTDFLTQKAERIAREDANERKRQNFLRNELKWMRRGAQARSTKQRARIERYEKVKAETPVAHTAKVEIGLVGSRLGRTVIEMEDVSLQRGGKKLVQNFTYTVMRNDRIGILGANGTGKTSLLEMMAGILPPDSGSVKIGQTVKIGYFSQKNTAMDERLRAIEYIKEEASYMTLADGSRLSASQLMEQFLFPGNLQWTPIAKLSGGEKRRLYLLRVLLSAPNVLLLDEPTNDLDLETMSVLENFLDSFSGAVIFATHDRFFLDRLAEKVFAVDGEGRWQKYLGGYSVNQDFFPQEEDKDKAAKVQPAAEEKKEKKQQHKRKFSYNEQREYETIEDVIASKEGELGVVKKQMTLCGADYARLQELSAEEERLTQEVAKLLERWEYLTEIAEAQNNEEG